MAETTPPGKGPIVPGKALEPDSPISQPPSTFESYMKDTGGAPRSVPNQAQGSHSAAPIRPPLESPAGAPSYDTLLAQTKNVQDGLGTVGQQLQSPNLKLKRSQAHLLKNKLQDANEYINSAANRLGVESPPQVEAQASPVGRFLAYIGAGQDQMTLVQKKLQELAASNEQIRPGDMLLIQVKMGQAQQEIEYSSSLLGKVIDSIKTIMNTQL